jgi:hypothetical protein
MSLPNSRQVRLRVARRVFSLIPLLVFAGVFLLFASQHGLATASSLGQTLTRSLVVALAASLVCVAAYGFYRYLHERSPGL